MLCFVRRLDTNGDGYVSLEDYVHAILSLRIEAPQVAAPHAASPHAVSPHAASPNAAAERERADGAAGRWHRALSKLRAAETTQTNQQSRRSSAPQNRTVSPTGRTEPSRRPSLSAVTPAW